MTLQLQSASLHQNWCHQCHRLMETCRHAVEKSQSIFNDQNYKTFRQVNLSLFSMMDDSIVNNWIEAIITTTAK